MRKFLISTSFVILVSCFAWGSVPPEGGDADDTSTIGPKKATQAYSSKEGIKLSDAAFKTMGLKSLLLQESTETKTTLPAKSLVFYGDKVGVYRVRNGWYRLVAVKVGKKTSQDVSVDFASGELKAGDQVVVEGAGFVRLADLDAESAVAESKE